MKKILFTGGGSAGHVLPNVALINDLQADGKIRMAYVGTNGIEKGLVAHLPIPFYSLSCPKLVRGGGFSALKNNLKIPVALHSAVRDASKVLQNFRPDLVFSKGGYVSLPVVLAAKKLKIPCFAHESDLSVGLANRLSAKKCQAVFTSFPETAEKVRGGKYLGAPVRKELLTADRNEARNEWKIPKRAKVLLVFGGGSGSQTINDEIKRLLPALTEKYYVLHVCGKGNADGIEGKNYRQFAFIADMGRAYACADLVVSRAGAGAIFELLALKKPAILIPLAGATRGDQKENAEYFQKRGLCRVLPQDRIFDLAKEIELAFQDESLKKNLLNSSFTAGNERIIAELYEALRV